jgi:hypothetical protein
VKAVVAVGPGTIGVHVKRIRKPKPLSWKKPSPQRLVRVVAGFPGVVAGFPGFWQKVYDQHPGFFDAAHDLVPLANRFLQQTVEGPLGLVEHCLTAIVANSFGALITLALNGYGHDAVRIARGMFEAAVNAAYLKLHPAEVEDYIDFLRIRQKKLYDYSQRYSPSDLLRIPAETIAEMKAEFAKVAHRFQDSRGKLRNSWCRKDLRARAEEVRLGEFYPTFYAHASGIHHGDIGGLLAQSARDALRVEVAPSFEAMKEALIMGHWAVLNILHSFNEVAGLKLDEELSEARDRFATAWKK